MPQEVIYPIPPEGRNRGDVTKLSRAFIDCAMALQGTGTDRAMMQFIIQHTGIVAAFTERLVDLRNNDITEETIALLLEGVYPTPDAGAVVEYRGVCIDRRSGKYAEACSVPPEHRAALSQVNIAEIFTATTPGHIRHDGGGPARFEAKGVDAERKLS